MKVVFKCSHPNGSAGGKDHAWEVESSVRSDLHMREAEIRDLLEAGPCPYTMEGYFSGYKRCPGHPVVITVEYRA